MASENGRGCQTDTAVTAGEMPAPPTDGAEPRGRAKKKSEWLRRLELIEAIDFESIAAEINRERWERIIAILQKSLPRDRKKMPGLFKKFDAGELTELPSHRRANPRRMRALLIGFHRRFGKYAETGKVINIPRLASDVNLAPATAKRSICDLCEGKLLDADRKRKRAGNWKRKGGQGPSLYRIPYSAIADRVIDSAQRNGFQRAFSLQDDSNDDEFDDATRASLPRRASAFVAAFRGDTSSAPAPAQSALAPAHCELPPAHCELPPAHCELPPAHSAPAPAHKSFANARAGASLSASLSESLAASPSPSRPANNLSCDTPSADAAETRRVESEGKKETESKTWDEVIERLRNYGLTHATLAARAARKNGWSVAQVMQLLDECEAAPAGTIGPGLVARHLQLADPGTSIAPPFSNATRREAEKFGALVSFAQARGCDGNLRTPPPAFVPDSDGRKKREAAQARFEALKAFEPELESLTEEGKRELIREIAERKRVHPRLCGGKHSLLEGLEFRASQRDRNK